MSKKQISKLRAAAIAGSMGLMISVGADAGNAQTTSNVVTYKTVKIDKLDVFYRESGDPKKPTILLLHGFPASSHMFRELIPKLSDKFHVVAPDYPGFGYSSAPARTEYKYTFDNLADVVDKFKAAIGIDRYAVYVQD